MTETINNAADLIDSRDIIARIEELEGNSMRDGIEEEELRQLKELAEQCEGYGDWEYGETLIRESYFEEYAQELAEDTGAIDSNAQWPLQHIDWEAAANELKIDYTEVDFDGVSYFIRA